MNPAERHHDAPDELMELLSAAADGWLDEPRRRQLESLLRRDPAARAAYIEHAIVQSLLARKHGCRNSHSLSSVLDSVSGDETQDQPANDSDSSAATGLFPSLVPTDVAAWEGTPLIQVGGIAADARLGPVGHFFASGWMAAYLIAAVICAVGLTVGSIVRVSRPDKVVDASDVRQPAPDARASVVARITGMVDCRWEGTGDRGQGTGDRGQGAESGQWSVVSGQNPSNHRPLATSFSPLSPLPSPLVRLGDTLALKSGLLELTYDTGARVILQGPVTYKVDSVAGGYLAIGKLTAKLEKRGQGTGDRGQGAGDRGQSVTGGPRSASHRSLSTLHSPLSTASNPQSPIPNPSLPPVPCPLFSIKTPTAIVTDLGTEFGVEVDRRGNTTSHVFRGIVQVQIMGAAPDAAASMRVLHADELARVERPAETADSEHAPFAFAVTAEPVQFVRNLPKRGPQFLDLVDLMAGGDGTSSERAIAVNPLTGATSDRPIRASATSNDFVGDGKYHRILGASIIDGVFIPDGRHGAVRVDSAGHLFTEFPETIAKTADCIWAGGRFASDDPTDNDPALLNDVDYSAPGHRWIYLHASKGITLDLDAVRRLAPDRKLVKLHAVMGNSERRSIRGETVSADVWILVDGQVRFRRREINGCSGAFPVVIPLRDSDRFLTFAATDGGNGIGFDWIIVGDPRLEFTTTDPEAKDTSHH